MINQLLPTISYGDAVSQSAVNIMKTLHSMGYESRIYAENIHPKMKYVARPAHECPKNQPVIYHLSTGSKLAYEIPKFTAMKVMIYHNITPDDYFRYYNSVTQALCREGREQLQFLASHIDYALADSEYNRRELEDLGYKKTGVAPIIINYEDYNQKPNENLMKKLRRENHIVNILFVGRIVPNKKQDDIIKTFYYYKRLNPNSRLFLVGSYQGMERYYHELVRLVKYLNLEDVYITGQLPFEHLLAYYSCADLFLCLSEHEGFCVPLIEAMYFGIPIIAYKSSAVGETLGNGGILVLEKDYPAIAELMNIVLNHHHIKNRILENQKERLKYFSKEKAQKIFKKYVETIFSGL